MTSVSVIDASAVHVEAFREGTRQADRREWDTALGSADFETSLKIAIRYPRGISRVAVDTVSGEVLAAWGVHRLQGAAEGVGQLWFVGRDAAYRRVHGIHHHWAREIGLLLSRYPILIAFSDSRQPRHHKWLERMDFELRGSVDFGSTPYRIYRKVA